MQPLRGFWFGYAQQGLGGIAPKCARNDMSHPDPECSGRNDSYTNKHGRIIANSLESFSEWPYRWLS